MPGINTVKTSTKTANIVQLCYKDSEGKWIPIDEDSPLPITNPEGNPLEIQVVDEDSNYIGVATEDTLSQLVMSVTNAIDEKAFDLNSAEFSETTAIDNDYELDNVEFNFSTIEARTITITSEDDTLLLNEEDNTDTSFAWQPSSEVAFNGGDNLTVTVTQFASAGTMDCILKIKQGSNSLLGDPTVKVVGGDGVSVLNVDQYVNAARVITVDHGKIHDGKAWTYAKEFVIGNNETLCFLLKNPAWNYPHLRLHKVFTTSAPGVIELYETPTMTDDGVLQIVQDRNRVSSNNPDLEIYLTPTITDIGTQIDVDILTGGKFEGGATQDIASEWILNQNINYLICYTNRSGLPTDLTANLFWYE